MTTAASPPPPPLGKAPAIAVLLAVLPAVLSCGGTQAPSTAPAASSTAGVIAVQGAIDLELEPLIEAVGSPAPRVIDRFSFWEGVIDGQAVVISRTEVGMVNAAVATMILIREYAPRLLINQGTAGAVNPELAVGDIVLGTASAQFGAFRTHHRDAGEGVDLDGWEAMPPKLRSGSQRTRFERFESDAGLLAAAREVPYAEGRLIAGVVGSADQWNRELDKMLWARRTYGIDSEDMESASVHQIAEIYSIPFLPVRIISNSEHHDPVFQPETGADCARFVVSLMRALAAR